MNSPDNAAPSFIEKVTDRASLESAVAEMQRCAAADEKINAQQKQAELKLKTDFTQRRLIEVDGKQMTLAERRDQLEAMVIEFVKTKQDEWFKQRKSLELPGAKVGFESAAPALVWMEGKSEKTANAAIEAKLGIKAKLMTWLMKVMLLQTPMAWVAKGEIKFSKSTANEHADKLPANVLRLLGLRMTKPTEVPFVRLSKPSASI